MEQSGIKNSKVGIREKQSEIKNLKSRNKRGTKWEQSGIKNLKVEIREKQSGNKWN